MAQIDQLARRLRKAGLTSAVCPSGRSAFGIGESLIWRAAMAASICLVTSGRAGAPSCVENLMPLYSGRIVRSGEVDGAGGLECAHGIGDGREWARLR